MEEKETNEIKEQTDKKNKVASFLIDTAKGVTLGISAAVPGLSAGTIAVAEKCYDGLVQNITNLRKQFKKSFLYLLPFILGAIVGAVAALIGIQKGYEAAPFSITGLFGGFVFGSLPVAISELKKGNSTKEKVIHIIAFLLCLFIAAGLGIITALNDFTLSTYLQERSWFIYLLAIVAGFIAAGTCVIPGISGSMSLMVIGMYIPIINTYATREGDLSIWASQDTMFKVTGFILLVILALSAIVGLVVTSKVMKTMLEKHRVSTFYGILGLILGSLVSMFFNSNIYPKYQAGLPAWDYIVGAILFVVCSVLSFFLIKLSNRQETSLR